MRANETNVEILAELEFNDKWLTHEYKQSRVYRDYLAAVVKDLQKYYS
jgi:hypothetical protein